MHAMRYLSALSLPSVMLLAAPCAALISRVVIVVSFIAISLTFAQASQRSDTAKWAVIRGSDAYEVSADGDSGSDPGASVVVRSAKESANGKYGGAIWKIDAAPIRGGTIHLSAMLAADPDGSNGAIWLRVDGQSGRVAFATSETDPIPLRVQPALRQISLKVPESAVTISYGAVLSGNGRLDAKSLRIRAMAGSGSEVSARDIFDKAIALIEENAYYASAVDWSSFRARHEAELSSSSAASDAYPQIRAALSLLGDGHSRLVAAEEAQRLSVGISTTSSVEVRKLPGVEIGYIKMPGFVGGDGERSKEFSRTVASRVCALSSSVSKGWILDLRENSGGNLWPMLASLKPLLGKDTVGYFRKSSGVQVPWRAGYNLAPGWDAECPDLSSSSVAVLVGPRTASAGEIVAVAFHGRPRTRSFGQQTAGMTSGNTSFPLPDGSQLALTTALALDRNAQQAERVIMPDISVPEVAGGGSASAAEAWLLSLQSSRTQ